MIYPIFVFVSGPKSESRPIISNFTQSNHFLWKCCRKCFRIRSSAENMHSKISFLLGKFLTFINYWFQLCRTNETLLRLLSLVDEAFAIPRKLKLFLGYFRISGLHFEIFMGFFSFLLNNLGVCRHRSFFNFSMLVSYIFLKALSLSKRFFLFIVLKTIIKLYI